MTIDQHQTCQQQFSDKSSAQQEIFLSTHILLSLINFCQPTLQYFQNCVAAI